MSTHRLKVDEVIEVAGTVRVVAIGNEKQGSDPAKPFVEIEIEDSKKAAAKKKTR